MQSENSTTKTFDKIKLLLQNLFDIAYLAFCYTSMFPRSILWSRLCLTKLNVRLHLLIFEHNFPIDIDIVCRMSIVMSLLRWWCSAKSKVFKILITMAYKNNLFAVCNNNINDAKKIKLQMFANLTSNDFEMLRIKIFIKQRQKKSYIIFWKLCIVYTIIT